MNITEEQGTMGRPNDSSRCLCAAVPSSWDAFLSSSDRSLSAFSAQSADPPSVPTVPYPIPSFKIHLPPTQPLTYPPTHPSIRSLITYSSTHLLIHLLSIYSLLHLPTHSTNRLTFRCWGYKVVRGILGCIYLGVVIVKHRSKQENCRL